jgi:hypothetical protein
MLIFDDGASIVFIDLDASDLNRLDYFYNLNTFRHGECQVALANNLGIINGYEDHTFQARQTTTRAEAVALF